MNMSDDFLKNLSKTFRETMGTVGKKTDEFVEIQKIRSRQGQLESRIENSYLEIGRKIYCRYRNGEAFDEQTAGLCQEILHMEKEIAVCKEQVAEKKGMTICPSCGASVSRESSFCMYCGAPVPEKKEDKAEDAEFTEVPEDAFEPEDGIEGKKPETEWKETQETSGADTEAVAEREEEAEDEVTADENASEQTKEEKTAE